MKRVLIVVFCALGALFACGEEEEGVYTEKKYIEDGVELYCDRLYECKKEMFDNSYSSIKECIQIEKDSRDTTSAGDDVFVYEPVCGVATLNLDMAKKYNDCMRDVSCSLWWDSSACLEYEGQLCTAEE